MMPSPTYTSIDAPSVNWCGVHAISYALYNEQILLQTAGPHTAALNELFTPPPERDAIHALNQDEFLEQALLDVGYASNEHPAILADIRKILAEIQPHESLEQLLQRYEQNEGAEIAQRVYKNYECSVKALLGQRANREIITKLTQRWTALAIDLETRQRLIREYSEIIATLREIVVFFDKNRQGDILQPLSVQALQQQLSPLVYHLYQKLAILPQEQQALSNHRLILSGILGTTELADIFINSVNSQVTVPSARAPERTALYQEDLQQRFELLQQAARTERAAHIDIPVPNLGNIHIACEPTYANRNNTNAFKLSAQMTQEISRLFFKNDRLPEVNTHSLFFAHDFDLFGGNTRYVIKNEDSHLKLLIRNADMSNIPLPFRRNLGFQIKDAPSGLSYFFGSFTAAAQTLLKLAAFLLAIYIFIRLCFARNSSQISSKPVRAQPKVPSPISTPTSTYAPIETRGILAPKKNIKFQKPKPPIPATLSRKELGRTYRK